MSFKNEAPTSKVFFPNLDALRFIAFSLVFLQHSFYIAFKPFEHYNYFIDHLISFFFVKGGTGVQIFFVLSGFLITYLIILEIKKNGKLDIGRFYMRRTLRIWPLYYAVVLFGFVIYPFLKGLSGAHYDLCSRPWYYFTFLSNFDVIHIGKTCPEHITQMQGILWSVSVEEQFYLVWPLLFLIFRKMQTAIFVIVVATCIAFRISVASSINDLYFHTLAVMGDLAIGGLGAYLILNSKKVLHFFESLPSKTILFAYVFILLVYFFEKDIFSFPYADNVSRWVLNLFWIFIILEQNFGKHSFFKLERLRFFSAWGKYTYGLYMLHPIALLIMEIAFHVAHIKSVAFITLTTMGILALLLSLLMARLSYLWLEMPFLKLKERLAVIHTKNV